MEITAAEQFKEKRMKRIEACLRDLWDSTKRVNMRIIGVPEEMKESNKILQEIIVENLPNMGKEIFNQVQ